MKHPVKLNLGTIANAIPSALLKELGATNLKMVSARTLQFDLQKPGLDGTNRVKVTIEDGKFMIRGYKIEETEVFYDIQPDGATKALKTLTTAA